MRGLGLTGKSFSSCSIASSIALGLPLSMAVSVLSKISLRLMVVYTTFGCLCKKNYRELINSGSC